MKKINYLLSVATMMLLAVVMYSCRKDDAKTANDERIQKLVQRYNLRPTFSGSNGIATAYRDLDDLERILKSKEKTVTNVTTELTTQSSSSSDFQNSSVPKGYHRLLQIAKFDGVQRLSSSSSEGTTTPPPVIPPPTPVVDPPGSTSCHGGNMSFNATHTVPDYSNGTNMLWQLNYSTNGSGTMQNPSLQGFATGHTPASMTVGTPNIVYTGNGKYHISVVTTQTETLTGSAGGFGTTSVTTWTLNYDTCNNTVNWSYTTRLDL